MSGDVRGDDMTGWSALFDRAWALIAVEPVQIQVVLLIAAAFLSVMVLEGLRLTFTPRRRMIRYLQLHAPEDASGDTGASQSYEAEAYGDTAMVLAQPAAEAKAHVFRSAGSLRPTIRRSPRDLLEISRDD
jgi:hypothetical protein